MHHAHFAHMLISAVIHGVIYDFIFKAMRGLSLPETGLVAALVVAGGWAVWRLLKRRRGKA